MRSRPGIAALPLLWAGLPSVAAAIMTRDDLPDTDYVVADAEFPQLVDLFRPGDCLGTLIDPSFLLTAAHCAVDLAPGATLVVAGVGHTVAEVLVHPDFQGGPNDIALIRFDVPVEGVTPIPPYRGTDEEGQLLTLAGRGVHATGLEGERQGSTDGLLRRATNKVHRATDQWLEAIFDAPGDPDVTDLEGIGAAGDSGGPAFIDNEDGRFVAGLNSWGDMSPYADLGKYGTRDNSTRVSTFVGWIDSVIGAADDVADDPDEPDEPDDLDVTGDEDPAVEAPVVRADAGCGCETGGGLRMAWGSAALALVLGWRARTAATGSRRA